MKKLVLILLVLVMAASVSACGYPFNEQHFKGVVTDVRETTVSDGESGTTHLKLVEVDNKDWYSVEDEMFLGQFRSRDMWGSLEASHTYEFTAYGYRNGFLSWYPNITAVSEVK